MFVQNQVSQLGNHHDVITSEIEKATQMVFVVAYVRENGVDAILDKIKGKSKSVQLLCSFDMGITQLSGIKKLLENGVEVKVYKSAEGTFHPKVWLFGNDNDWKMLIGSANLTRAALIDNVEASMLVEDQSAISNALIFFKYLWEAEESHAVTLRDIGKLQNKVIEREKFKSAPAQARSGPTDAKKANVLFEYVKNWVDIPKFDSKGISTLWRGWYVIPDHGHVTDELVRNLKSYLPFIAGGIHLSDSDAKYARLLEQFEVNSNFQRANLRTSMHGLFVRQAKNYLQKFGWCRHPIKQNGKADRKMLDLTDLGVKVNQCRSLAEVKALYTEYFFRYSFNGLCIVPFTEKLLKQLGHLTLDEFNFFVVHAYHDDDLDLIVDLVNMYRSLSNPAAFNERCVAYFRKVKEPTAKYVYGNYVKNVRHNISVIGWCRGFSLADDLTLKRSNEG